MCIDLHVSRLLWWCLLKNQSIITLMPIIPVLLFIKQTCNKVPNKIPITSIKVWTSNIIVYHMEWIRVDNNNMKLLTHRTIIKMKRMKVNRMLPLTITYNNNNLQVKTIMDRDLQSNNLEMWDLGLIILEIILITRIIQVATQLYIITVGVITQLRNLQINTINKTKFNNRINNINTTVKMTNALRVIISRIQLRLCGRRRELMLASQTSITSILVTLTA